MSIPTLLITGTNRGLGLEFVRQYSQAGWKVHACCRNSESAEALRRVHIDLPELVKIHTLDVSNFNAIEALANQLKNESIDVLLSNAGAYGNHRQDITDMDFQNWSDVFCVNTMAAMKLAIAFIDQVAGSQSKKMAFMSSKMGSLADNGTGGLYTYRSTKAALNTIVKNLALDLEQMDIKVIALHPGWAKTDMGGPNALITATESVSGMRKVIEELSMCTTGCFLDYSGNEVPW